MSEKSTSELKQELLKKDNSLAEKDVKHMTRDEVLDALQGGAVQTSMDTETEMSESAGEEPDPDDAA